MEQSREGLIYAQIASWLKARLLLKALSVSILNQVVSSGTNFALGIYLVRVLAPAEYGIYGIGIALSLFYSGVGNALFLTQMVVHVPEKLAEDRVHYAAQMFVAVALFSLATSMLVGSILLLVGELSVILDQYVGIGLATLAASIAYLLKDYFVRFAYTSRKETWALAINVIVMFAMLAALTVMFFYGQALNAEIALWIYALSNIMGALLGLILMELPIGAVKLNESTKVTWEAWAGGRWSLGGVLVTWLQSQAYIYVTALLAGAAAVGYANAARLLVAPVMVAIPAIYQIALPRLAEMRYKNIPRMLKISLLITVGLLLLGVMYSAILVTFEDEFAQAMIGRDYIKIDFLVAAWCLVMIFQISRGSLSILLQAMKEFRGLTIYNVPSAVVAVAAAALLIKAIGIDGAVLGTAVGEMVLTVLLANHLRKKYNEIR